MRTLFQLLLLALVCAGCSWNPTRDNPADPASPFYLPPPPRNHPPAIGALAMTSDCRQVSQSTNLCAFTLSAQVADSDNNLLFGSVYALIQRRLPDPAADTLGVMRFDLLRQVFVIQRDENEIPEHDLTDLVGKPVIVVAQDDSGAVGSDTMLFTAPVEGPWPIADVPRGNIYRQDTVDVLTPRLSWVRWGEPIDGHTFSVTVSLYGTIPIWDTSGIAAVDTFVFVTDTLINQLDWIDAFYSWTLTVTDWRGNILTAAPEYFNCQVSSAFKAAAPPSPFVKREP